MEGEGIDGGGSYTDTWNRSDRNWRIWWELEELRTQLLPHANRFTLNSFTGKRKEDRSDLWKALHSKPVPARADSFCGQPISRDSCKMTVKERKILPVGRTVPSIVADQPSMAGKAPNETDTSTLEVPSRSSSPAPHHRPGHRRAHRHHKSHHHGVAHHHGESHHHGEFQGSPDNAFSRHSPDPPHPLTQLRLIAPSPPTTPMIRHPFMMSTTTAAGDIMVGPTTLVTPTPRRGSTTPVSFAIMAGSITKASPPTLKSTTKTVSTLSEVGPIPLMLTTTASTIIIYPTTTEVSSTTAATVSTTTATVAIVVSTTTGSTTMGSILVDLYAAHSMARASSVFQPSTAHKQSMAISLMRSRSTVHSHPPRAPAKSILWNTSLKPQRAGLKMSKIRTKPAKPRGSTRRHTVGTSAKMLSVLTQSLIFDAFIFIVVCLNIIMLVAQTFANVEIRGEWYFMVFDCIFLSIYVVEALLKIITMGLDYFYDSWNILDFFIMAMAALEFTLVQFNSRSLKRTVYNPNFFRIFKVFKSLRALRAVRVLRRLSFLTSVQEVTGTLVRSMPSITAILVLMFTCLCILCCGAGVEDGGGNRGQGDGVRQALRAWFGPEPPVLFSVVLRGLFRQSDPNRFQNIFTTIFTLFTLLTLDDWSQIYVDSRANGAWYIIPILMIYIVIQYFIFLNLVIAVLVDNFQMALLRGLEKVKQERAAQIQEKLLAESLTMLSEEEPKEVMSEHTKQKLLIEKKFGTMTTKQQELLFHFLQLSTGVEHYQQKFRSQASVIDEIVDTAFEAGEEDFRK
ncbi:hypothetical protein QTO34_003364 [Cnephaeus nilssonii]|uniref:Cation channel sperm-associated protein 1 n=1 Tax=Cnephaeus nilssonii TaxID=3371016 RepID=A0AA40HQH7_CNENI|nr:hypothetical protein QTO34_003364 [Eptesicus nilssonii]